jgi:chemotaxis signal transduction protein
MITIRKDNDVFVFKVDELLRAKRINSEMLSKPPATLSKSYKVYTKSIFMNDNDKIAIIDSDIFFKTLKESLHRV